MQPLHVCPPVYLVWVRLEAVMVRAKVTHSFHLGLLPVLLFSMGCREVLQLEDYRTQLAEDAGTLVDAAKPADGCERNRDCAARQAEGSARGAPTICHKATKRCVTLTSEDCQNITGDYTADEAIVIGSLFSTSGAQASINHAREQSAVLAVDEINAAGGVPAGATSAGSRPLVLVSCDEAQLLRAAGHLVNDLTVPAIIGPNTSQDTLDLSNKLTIGTGTLVISPTAVASSIADLLDEDLTWQMVPTDVQRAPLMRAEINTLEQQLRTARGVKSLKLAVIYRDDALGQGTRVGLNALEFNGAPLTDPINLGSNVHILPYQPSQVGQTAMVDSTLKFAPDIIVLAGTAEAVTQVLVPIERGWTGPLSSRPEYVLIDSLKASELIDAVTGNPDLRHRVRGTGTRPASRSVAVNESFMVSYATRHPNEPTNLFGMGATYDATYAVAYGIAALRGRTITGRTISQNLPLLGRSGVEVELQGSKVLSAFRHLTETTPVTIIGTNAPLQWDSHGAILGGTIELWCISEAAGRSSYDSSGITFDLQLGRTEGTYVQCAP
jgi:ABC-type branched-subunit amino acid transport system substrate-binding protein